MEMKWGKRGEEKESDGVGCVGTALVQDTHIYTHWAWQLGFKFTLIENHPSSVQSGYHSDVQLYKGLISFDKLVRSNRGHHHEHYVNG